MIEVFVVVVVVVVVLVQFVHLDYQTSTNASFSIIVVLFELSQQYRRQLSVVLCFL